MNRQAGCLPHVQQISGLTGQADCREFGRMEIAVKSHGVSRSGKGCDSLHGFPRSVRVPGGGGRFGQGFIFNP
jgi:hypothetical protein